LILAADNNRPKICRLIARAHLEHIAQQKECVYTTLNCLKRVPGGQYVNLRHILKPMLRAMIQDVRQPMLDDINQIPSNDIKRELLALCDQQQNQNRSANSCIIL